MAVKVKDDADLEWPRRPLATFGWPPLASLGREVGYSQPTKSGHQIGAKVIPL